MFSSVASSETLIHQSPGLYSVTFPDRMIYFTRKSGERVQAVLTSHSQELTFFITEASRPSRPQVSLAKRNTDKSVFNYSIAGDCNYKQENVIITSVDRLNTGLELTTTETPYPESFTKFFGVCCKLSFFTNKKELLNNFLEYSNDQLRSSFGAYARSQFCTIL